ncbi:hypothetical protein LZK76_12710 [Rhizobium leguminosarum]|nr:hypothetical protein LZK76_12710 [Rhizobium leguminosarum]
MPGEHAHHADRLVDHRPLADEDPSTPRPTTVRSFFDVGDAVRFRRISRAEFDARCPE